jgi:hypothetical protein
MLFYSVMLVRPFVFRVCLLLVVSLFRIAMFILIYHPHKPIDLKYQIPGIKLEANFIKKSCKSWMINYSEIL